MNWRTFYKNFYPEFQSVAFSNGEFIITNRYFLIDFKNGKKQLIIKISLQRERQKDRDSHKLTYKKRDGYTVVSRSKIKKYSENYSRFNCTIKQFQVPELKGSLADKIHLLIIIIFSSHSSKDHMQKSLGLWPQDHLRISCTL